MKLNIFGYEFIIRKSDPKSRIISVMYEYNLPMTKIGAIKALRLIEPGIGLYDAKMKVEELFTFDFGELVK